MKKIALIVSFILMSFLLYSCGPSFMTKNISQEKKEIVQDKFGEVEYISENILIFKNLSRYFAYIEGIDYIINNSGDRGCVNPTIAENFYVLIDIIKYNNEYKLLIYNNIMKLFADKTKMFVMSNYLLPFNVEDINDLIDEFNVEQDFNNFTISFNQKDANVENFFESNEITNSYYNQIFNGNVYMSFYDYNSGNVIVGKNRYDVIFGNLYDKTIYYPDKLDYYDYINNPFDTLDNEKVSFSLDKGNTFNTIDNRLEEFDIWSQSFNNFKQGIVFFYAYTYDEFIIEVNKIRNLDFYEYNYPENESFDELINNYNENYFENNILIFYYKYESNISPNYIYSITKHNQKLTVNVNRFEGMATALSAWLEVITINKEDVKDIDEINLIVRTISEKQSSIVLYINDQYMRDFYLSPKSIDDFSDLDNLKDIRLFTWSLSVDLIFNQEINDDDLNRVLNYLESNPNLRSIGYKGKDKIRVQLKDSFYDKIMSKTLKLTDFFDNNDLIDEFSFNIYILDIIPIAYVEFILIEPGREYVDKFINDIKKLEYPFFEYN